MPTMAVVPEDCDELLSEGESDAGVGVGVGVGRAEVVVVRRRMRREERREMGDIVDVCGDFWWMFLMMCLWRGRRTVR